jgi:hypothetical protein
MKVIADVLTSVLKVFVILGVVLGDIILIVASVVAVMYLGIFGFIITAIAACELYNGKFESMNPRMWKKFWQNF